MVFSRFGTPEGFASPAYTFALKPAIPSAGGSVTAPSPRRNTSRYRNINRLSIDCAFRLRLRSRLTHSCLTSLWKPWSCGERVSYPFDRYSFLHFLFPSLHRASRLDFRATGMLSYLSCLATENHSFGNVLHTRLLSMPDRSTSELLRTL